MQGFINKALVAVSLSFTVGCSDPVTPESLAGTYVATTFVMRGIDVLADGGSLTITFNAAGTTSGNLFIPASSAVSGSQDFDVDMAGTFSVSGTSVTFTQAALSFVPDLDWTTTDDRMNGTGTFVGQTITVVLTRQ